MILAVFAMALGSCGSDPEGPVTKIFIDDGSYPPEAGETVRLVDTLASVSIVDFPLGIGKSSLLRIGEVEGIRFESILMKFDFDSIGNYADLTVDSVYLDLPVTIIEDTLFHMKVTFNELLEDFDEEDTLTVIPLFDPVAIQGEYGETVRDINIERNSFSLDKEMVQGWIDGGTPWPFGISINWAGEPDTLGLIEMKSHNYRSDPPVLKVIFSDETVATFPVTEDYVITSFTGSSDRLDCVGGVATRIFFEFGLEDLPPDAMIHYSALVLHTDGSNGLGATGGDLLLGLTSDFIYYLYTPDSGDTGDPGFFKGTGVAVNTFLPTISEEIRIPLVGFTLDLHEGLRENTGLVLQSNQEYSRFQKASFYSMSAADSLRPYIEVVYSLPPDFSGE